MKAIVLTKYGGPDALELREVADPSPGPKELQVAVAAVSVNDWDWCLTRGAPFYIRLLCGLLRPKVTIPGLDVAGTVEAVGAEVTRFRPGDAVYGDLSEHGFGGFAQYVCAPESVWASMPSGMNFVEASALPHAGVLAVQGLIDDGHVAPGQTLLINGAGGGVGTIALQIARTLGVTDVTGVDSAAKSHLLRTLGFDHVIAYEQEDFTRSGGRYDLILDTKTNRSVFKYLKALSPGGAYVTVGGKTARLLQIVSCAWLIRRLTGKSVRIVALKPNKDLDYISELYRAGRLKPIMDGPFPLNATAEAIRRFGAGTHKGKVIVEVDARAGPAAERDSGGPLASEGG